jgi:predicted CXXCH cytochrome family protein
MPASRTVHTSEIDHPEFKLIRDKIRDPDTLRFSHKTHQASNPRMVQMAGNNLNCAFCHKPSGSGEYYQPVSFVRSCQVCHSLQFDKRNPELVVPHGSAEFVHAFLRSLPAQYAEYGGRVKHLQNPADLEQFVQQELRQLQAQFGSGEELEEKVFFSTDISGPIADPARLGSQGRSLFPGCAYCHEVQRKGAVPVVGVPVQPARWLNRGMFDHGRHTNFQCAECHNVSGSTEASDVLLPSQKICATCHRPQGGARNDCAACHWYHNDEKTGLRVTGRPSN